VTARHKLKYLRYAIQERARVRRAKKTSVRRTWSRLGCAFGQPRNYFRLTFGLPSPKCHPIPKCLAWVSC